MLDRESLPSVLTHHRGTEGAENNWSEQHTHTVFLCALCALCVSVVNHAKP